MRVVGYVRESADPSVAPSAFSQQETLRRHAAERGYQLVAVCQDLRSPGMPTRRDGYVSMIGVVASGGVDAVLVPDLATFSSDAIVQEIVMWDLRTRGMRVVSVDAEDTSLLDQDTQPEPSRMLIRDVLDRVDEHATQLLPRFGDAATPDADVFIHLVEADSAEHDLVR
jgi:DNA invertase Pin-like site-specific DNA recombinase